jgi:hypothetical protein
VLILGTRQVWNGAGRRRYSWKFLFLLQFYQTCMERERKVERTKRVMQWQWANTTRPDTPDMKNKDNLRVPLDLTWVDGKKRDVKKKKKKLGGGYSRKKEMRNQQNFFIIWFSYSIVDSSWLFLKTRMEFPCFYFLIRILTVNDCTRM